MKQCVVDQPNTQDRVTGSGVKGQGQVRGKGWVRVKVSSTQIIVLFKLRFNKSFPLSCWSGLIVEVLNIRRNRPEQY